jgi:hypothetical protein
MNWTLLSRHALRFAVVILPAIALYQIARAAGLHAFTARETEGFNTLILLLGSIYAVMYAFVMFVIWTQFTEMESLAARECSSLDDLLRFSRYVNADTSQLIRRAVTTYARLVGASEWESLARREKDPETEKAFGGVLKAVVQGGPEVSSETTMRNRLIDIAGKVAQCRDERVAKSLTRIPPTLLSLVRGMALAITLLVFAYPFHHTVTGVVCLLLTASVLFFADVVMIDTDNPFSGLCNASPGEFTDLIV